MANPIALLIGYITIIVIVVGVLESFGFFDRGKRFRGFIVQACHFLRGIGKIFKARSQDN